MRHVTYPTIFLSQGFRTTKGSKLLGSRFEEQRLTLRIHRGRSVQNHHGRTQNNTPKPISPNGRLHHSSTSRIPRSRSLERIKVHLTPPPQRGTEKYISCLLSAVSHLSFSLTAQSYIMQLRRKSDGWNTFLRK